MGETERRNIGQVLKGFGRITEDDIEAAVAYQRENGGFFGEALIACGFVSEDELEFGLASQFDLPYLFPEADAVDLEAAALVSPEWALEHLTLPILKTEDTLKVVVDSPLKAEPLEALRLRAADLEVEVGLASPATIRELIRQVYARAAALDDEPREPLSLENTLDAVDDAEASRRGISIRGGRAHAWWDDRGTIRRRTLAGDWAESLEGHLEPPPAEVVTEARTEWDATIGRGKEVKRVTVHCIADESGREYLFLPRRAGPVEERFTPPPPGIVSEIRILAREGTARFVVSADPVELGHDILPHLPELTLEPGWRSIYLHAGNSAAAARAFSVELPADPETWAAEIEALKVFHFDAVTVDLSGGEESWVAAALDVASVAFLLWPDVDAEGARTVGVRWLLGIRRDADGLVEWSLESLDA